jgi:hypothetical protein
MNSRLRPAAAVNSVRLPMVALRRSASGARHQAPVCQRNFFSFGRPGACSQSHKTPADELFVTRRASSPPGRCGAAEIKALIVAGGGIAESFALAHPLTARQ